MALELSDDDPRGDDEAVDEAPQEHEQRPQPEGWVRYSSARFAPGVWKMQPLVNLWVAAVFLDLIQAI